MEKFKSFITEEEKEQSYKFVVLWYNDPNDPDNSEINAEIGRAHVRTPVTSLSRMPSSA